MKIIEENENGVWFEDSYGHECFMTYEEMTAFNNSNKEVCVTYGSNLLKDKCELSLAMA